MDKRKKTFTKKFKDRYRDRQTKTYADRKGYIQIERYMYRHANKHTDHTDQTMNKETETFLVLTAPRHSAQ